MRQVRAHLAIGLVPDRVPGDVGDRVVEVGAHVEGFDPEVVTRIADRDDPDIEGGRVMGGARIEILDFRDIDRGKGAIGDEDRLGAFTVAQRVTGERERVVDGGGRVERKEVVVLLAAVAGQRRVQRRAVRGPQRQRPCGRVELDHHDLLRGVDRERRDDLLRFVGRALEPALTAFDGGHGRRGVEDHERVSRRRRLIFFVGAASEGAADLRVAQREDDERDDGELDEQRADAFERLEERGRLAFDHDARP